MEAVHEQMGTVINYLFFRNKESMYLSKPQPTKQTAGTQRTQLTEGIFHLRH